MGLRDYQLELIDRVREEYAHGVRSVLLQLPTGGGKTHVAASIIQLSVNHHKRVIFAAHLDALIADTSKRLTDFDIQHGIIQATHKQNPQASVQVASIATLHRRPECRPLADIIIIDECRRAAAPSVRGILEAYPYAKLLGLDATPQRSDGKPLGDIFDSLVCGPSVKTLTAAGHLVPAHVYAPTSPIESALAMDPVDAWQEYAAKRNAILFARDVQDATEIAARLPCRAVVITGETSSVKRQEAREALSKNEIDAIVNVDVYRDGADLPSIDCVILARNFTVTSSYLQACGRGLRAHQGKTNCIIVDLSGASIVFGLPEDDRQWSLEKEPQRVGDGLIALSRCCQCFAVFHAITRICPRCGEKLVGTKLKRRATRIERQELQRLDTRPQSLRDAIAIDGISKRLRMSGRFSEGQIPHIARSIFYRKNRRSAA